ncbi:hypothetical protein LTR84_006711 [Exophiala bonariae]|uniref:NmrA-like domain-containing protein n=1 Tax=Exophiala bonariae TaxID=1690606 RepID=A0AAV9N2B1_9EURO|nr:hypothetical protein LTR84_006711 [Exophiala bonariae]
MASELSANVFVAPPTLMKAPDGQNAGTWPPIACTLVIGPRSAILINTPFTIANTIALADWAPEILGQKMLVAIYVSHGLGDFFSGLPTLRKRFPDVKTYCTQTTLKAMKASVEPQAFKAFSSQFPGQIDDQPSPENVAEAIPTSNELDLDGYKLKAIHVGQAAVADSTIIWQNKDYIETFSSLIETGKVKTAAELTTAMTSKYPDRFNIDALIYSSQIVFREVTLPEDLS